MKSVRPFALLLCVGLTALTLSGCDNPFNKDKNVQAATVQIHEISGKLTVCYVGSKEQFMNEYGKMFFTRYPNVEIDVISPPRSVSNQDNAKTMQTFITQKDIDVVVLGDSSM